MTNNQTFEGAEKVVYVVLMEEEENAFLVDVWWSVNLPNNPSADEILEDFVKDSYGNKEYDYFCLDNVDKYETGALKYLYPEMS